MSVTAHPTAPSVPRKEPLDFTVSDWGNQQNPFSITSGNYTKLFELDGRSDAVAAAFADIAGRRAGPGTFHLGYYGYLLVCDAVCQIQYRSSILSLHQANWRGFYEQQLLPGDAVRRASDLASTS